MHAIRRRNPAETDKNSGPNSDNRNEKPEGEEEEIDSKKHKNKKKKSAVAKAKQVEAKRIKWSCVDSCCWLIGCICTIWWVLLFLYKAMPSSFPQYVTEAITGPLPDPPGAKLRKEGLRVKHPVVFVPGIVTGGLELWEGHQCADGLFRKRLWGGTFGEAYKRYGSTISGSSKFCEVLGFSLRQMWMCFYLFLCRGVILDVLIKKLFNNSGAGAVLHFILKW
jgi:phospholipid:diacylglycerol acyltransferase